MIPTATLTSIGSQDENNFIFSLISNARIAPWLGGTDALVEGTWRWDNLRITRADRVFASQSLIVERERER